MTESQAQPSPQEEDILQTIHQSNEETLQTFKQNADDAAENLIIQFQQLRSALQAMTNVSIQCSRTYKLAIDSVCEGTDSSILALDTLMNKCRILLRELRTISELSDQMFVGFFFHLTKTKALHSKSLKEAVGVLESHVQKATH